MSAFAQPDNGSLVGAGLSSFPLPTFLLLVPDRGWVSGHNNHASDTGAGAANNSIRMHKRVNRQHFLDFGDMMHLGNTSHKKNRFLSGIAQITSPLPPPPNSGKLYNFFWTSKTMSILPCLQGRIFQCTP